MSNFNLGTVTTMTEGFISIPELGPEPVILFGTDKPEMYAVTAEIFSKSEFDVGDILTFVIENPVVHTTTMKTGGRNMPMNVITGCSYVKRYDKKGSRRHGKKEAR